MKAFAQGSLTVADAMAKNSHAYTVTGGDSVSATNMAGVADKMSHVSTGGGGLNIRRKDTRLKALAKQFLY